MERNGLSLQCSANKLKEMPCYTDNETVNIVVLDLSYNQLDYFEVDRAVACYSFLKVRGICIQVIF